MSNTKKKYLIISPFFSPNNGGVETFLDTLVQYSREKDISVDVVTYQPLTSSQSAPFKEVNDSNTIYRLHWPKFNLFYRLESRPYLQIFYLGTGLFFLSAYLMLMHRKDYTSVNAHGLSAGFVCYVLSYLFPHKYVLTIHTNYRFKKEKLLSKVVKKISNRMSKLLVISGKSKENLIDIGIEASRVEFFHNWMTTTPMHSADKSKERVEIGLEPTKYYALFVGRFSKEKGILNLLEALSGLDPRITILIIGGGFFDMDVQTASQKYENVFYLGRKEPHETLAYMRSSDVLIFAPVDEDYFGRVSIEAMYCGLPIIYPTATTYGNELSTTKVGVPTTVGFSFIPNSDGINQALTKSMTMQFDKEDSFRYVEENYGKKVNGTIYLKALGIYE